jgi:hypothetical protein
MKSKCKKYAQAITDYVLGEETDVPKEELMTHLKTCAQCRKEATNWQDFQDMLRVKEYHSRPEVKEKWDRFFKELTGEAQRSPDERRDQPRSAPVCAKPACAADRASTDRPSRSDICLDGAIDLNLDKKVGEPAGILWQAIGRNEPVNILDLPQVSQLEPPKAFSSFGWLAHEKKVVMKKNHQGIYVCLTPAEKEKYSAAVRTK